MLWSFYCGSKNYKSLEQLMFYLVCCFAKWRTVLIKYDERSRFFPEVEKQFFSFAELGRELKGRSHILLSRFKSQDSNGFTPNRLIANPSITEDPSMTLTYHGAKYTFTPQTIETVESSIECKFRGQVSKLRVPKAIPAKPVVHTLTYRGVRYQA